MSDTSTNAPAEGAAPPAAPPPAAPAPPPLASPPAGADAPDADWVNTDPADFSSWPEPAKDYVHRLRDEAKTHREAATAAKPFQEAMAGLHPQDADFMRDFLATLSIPDENQRRERVAPFVEPLRGLLEQLSPAQQQAVADAAAAAEKDGQEAFDPYDTDALDKRFETKLEERLAAERKEREQQDRDREQQQSVKDWQQKMSVKASELADTHKVDDFKDPRSMLGRLLYITAQHEFAHESDPMKRLELSAQSIVEGLDTKAQLLLKAKAADAGPSPAPADAGAPAGAKKPTDRAAARQSALERVDRIMGGSVGT